MTIQNETQPEQPNPQPGFYQHGSSYVKVIDTTGLVFMSIMGFILLSALLRSEKRCRELLSRLAESGEV